MATTQKLCGRRRSSLFVKIHQPNPAKTNQSKTFRRLKFVCKIGAICCFAVFFAIATIVYSNYKSALATVDARLKNGYLISQPGIYAAPMILRAGRALDADGLTVLLKRAGYADGDQSDVWSGSYHQIDQTAVEIKPRRFDENSHETVKILFAKNNRIAGIVGDNGLIDSFRLEPEFLTAHPATKTVRRQILRFEDLPENLVNAIVAAEDRSFFRHSGFDLSGIGRAAWKNFALGRQAHGGSTITQQLVKNTYLNHDRTLARKYNELLLAAALEQRLTKPEIFAIYCNEIYLGQQGEFVVRGFAQAASAYFGKELQDLTVAEAALLAGMIKSPQQFSPEKHLEKSIERRALVLKAMVKTGKITETEADFARREEIKLSPIQDNKTAIAPHYLDYVRRFVEKQLPAATENQANKPENSIVRTTIDLDLQRAAQTILDRRLEKLAQIYRTKEIKPQGAIVALDPRTGDILALVGGSDYARSQLNRATDARRQPGSIFKPFVAATAIEDGTSPLARFMDAPTEFKLAGNQKYSPQNYGKHYSNQPVTLRTALVKSLNTVTVELALQIGIQRVANKAHEFGLPRADKVYPSLALGTLEASPIEIAAAYATFANGGVRVKPNVIAAAETDSAVETDEQIIDKKQVLKPETAFMMTDILSEVIENGTAKSAKSVFKNIAVAGKTGTTEKDGWFVGYTPNLVVAVWVGFDAGDNLGLTGAESALPIWTEFVSQTVDARPEFGGAAFAVPANIIFAEVDPATGQFATVNCPTRVKVALAREFMPTGECFEHKPQTETPAETLVADNAAKSIIENARRHLTAEQLSPRFAVGAFVAEKPESEIAQTADLQRQMNEIQFDHERNNRRRSNE